MEWLLNFLDGYGTNFAVALSLWPLASLLLTLPILALLYHRDGLMRASTVGAAYLSVLYGLSLVCFTLYPLPSGDSGLGITYGIAPQLHPLGFINDIAKDGIHAVPQILANISFFIPLGFIAGKLFHLSARASLLVGLCISFLIETAQLTGLFFLYPYSYRTFDVCDLLWNVLGTGIGWIIFTFIERLFPSKISADIPTTYNPGFVRRVTAFCLDATFVGCIAIMTGIGTQVLCAAITLDSENGLKYANATSLIMGIALFVLFEIVLPWKSQGSTPGGKFVHMSFETQQRQGLMRIAFYTARTICIIISFQFSFFAIPILAVFYAVKRCMPYDLIPSDISHLPFLDHKQAATQN